VPAGTDRSQVQSVEKSIEVSPETDAIILFEDIARIRGFPLIPIMPFQSNLHSMSAGFRSIVLNYHVTCQKKNN
jgi:hypothetical protein